MLKLPTQHQQYIQYLENQQESQTKALNFGIVAAVEGLKIRQQDLTAAGLLKQCSETLDLITKQWSLMKGQWRTRPILIVQVLILILENGIVPPQSMLDELKRLRIKQSMLAGQVAADSKLLKDTNDVWT